MSDAPLQSIDGWRMSDGEREQLHAMYQTMRPDDLTLLRQALVLDIAGGAARVFCEARLGIIDRVLVERGAYICPRCGAVSFHPRDLANRYCGRCHLFEQL